MRIARHPEPDNLGHRFRASRQRVIELLSLSDPARGKQRGRISYALLGINRNGRCASRVMHDIKECAMAVRQLNLIDCDVHHTALKMLGALDECHARKTSSV